MATGWYDRLAALDLKGRDRVDRAFPTPCLVCGDPVSRSRPGIKTTGFGPRWGFHFPCINLVVHERLNRLKKLLSWLKSQVSPEEQAEEETSGSGGIASVRQLANERYRRARLRRKRARDRRD
jgi:hypothetical protein